MVIYAVHDEPPDGDYSLLVHHEMASCTPHTLHFDHTERGIRGAWSDIKSFVVP